MNYQSEDLVRAAIRKQFENDLTVISTVIKDLENQPVIPKLKPVNIKHILLQGVCFTMAYVIGFGVTINLLLPLIM
jgi:hypothetical protein